MKLLISDANILIDLEEGQIVNLIFQLEHEYLIPDILFIEELEEQHKELLDLGLRLRELSSDSMSYAIELIQRYPKPSRNDCLTIALAKQEDCPLLTGDKDLRAAAAREAVQVNGTIWVVEQLILNQILTIDDARKAFGLMKESNRRLPWKQTEQMLKRII